SALLNGAPHTLIEALGRATIENATSKESTGRRHPSRGRSLILAGTSFSERYEFSCVIASRRVADDSRGWGVSPNCEPQTSGPTAVSLVLGIRPSYQTHFVTVQF